MDDYIFRRLDDNSYYFMKELYFKSFHVKESISGITSKYDTAYTGIKNVGYLAFDNQNSPAAYYGVFPMILSSGGSDLLVAQSGDTMTAPEHRGKGLFILLAKQAYQLAQDNGIRMIFGFPNKNSFPGFQKKLNWEFYGCMQRFSIENSTIPFCEFSAAFKSFAALYLRYCRMALRRHILPITRENIDPFTDPVSSSFTRKDTSFFQYKLRNPFNFLIGIDGFHILLKPMPHLLIGAISYFPPEKIHDFFKAVNHLAGILGCKKTQLTVSPNHWLFGYLTPFFKPEETLPIGFLKCQYPIPVETISFTMADYDTF